MINEAEKLSWLTFKVPLLVAALVLLTVMILIGWRGRPERVGPGAPVAPVVHAAVKRDPHVQRYRQYLNSGGTVRDDRFGRAVLAVVQVARGGGAAREGDLVYAVGLPDRRTSSGGVVYLEYDARGLGTKTTFIMFDSRGVLLPEIGLYDAPPPRR